MLQQANKTQEVDTTQQLKEMNQKLREAENLRASQAQQREQDAAGKKEVKNNFNKAFRGWQKTDDAHAEKIVEIKDQLAGLETQSAQAAGSPERRHHQLTQMTEIVAQTNIQAEVQQLAADLAGEIGRLSGEINKHNQFEAEQLEELQRASAHGGRSIVGKDTKDED